ncbi:MAG: hypothetical protein ACRDHP_17780, partial [Ktedonobacterales bacterium]
MGWGRAARLIIWRDGSGGSHRRNPASIMCAAGVGLALLLVAVFGVAPALGVHAAPDCGVPPSASCQALAGLDSTATNGGAWG